jgi:uncharacterized linocin/CFP29 family protein
MSHLLREHAPVTEAGWRLLDDEARGRLQPALGARRLVDFDGPHGWDFSASNLGRSEEIGNPPWEGVAARRRRVLPLLELRVDFSVSRSELEDAERGAEDVDLGALDAAALRIAGAENAIVFGGWEAASIAGAISASTNDPIALGDDCGRYPNHVAMAVDTLRSVGVDGPYGLALGPDAHTRVLETAEHGGYPLLEHLREIVGGPIVWVPAVEGGAVVSLRGRDLLFDSGQDLAIGYTSHDATSVDLYIEESFSFRVATPEAVVGLNP